MLAKVQSEVKKVISCLPQASSQWQKRGKF